METAKKWGMEVVTGIVMKTSKILFEHSSYIYSKFINCLDNKKIESTDFNRAMPDEISYNLSDCFAHLKIYR